MAKYVGVTEQFKDVINTFHTPEGETPAGFKRELVMEKDGVVKVDLVRDISYDKNGILRPTNVLFSADSANPYEVEPISPLISNLTCNRESFTIYLLIIQRLMLEINIRTVMKLWQKSEEYLVRDVISVWS